MKKFTLKITSVLTSFILLFTLMLTSCSAGTEGFAEIKKTRDLYTGLDSAYITVTDLETNKLLSQFAFRYEGDLLTYYYMNKSGGNIYYEHHSGYKLSYGYYGDNGWTELENGSSDYYFYNKNNKHPNTERDMIFFIEENVLSAEVTKFGGSVQVNCEYDVSAVNKKTVEKLIFKPFTELTEFIVKIVIGADGYVERILYTGKADGKVFNIQTEIKSMNKVLVIERYAFP